MSKFKIEDNVPIPKKQQDRNEETLRSVIKNMAPGQSLFLEGKSRGYAQVIYNYGYSFGYKMTCLKVDGGLRCWRVS